MILGNLSDVLDNEKNIYEAVQNNVFGQQPKKQSKISKILTSLSHYGMNYTEDLMKNMRAVPADKLLQQNDDPLDQSLYTARLDNWSTSVEETKPYAEKTIDQKREKLRAMAEQPELEDILDIMANECIVYDDEEAYIAQPFLDSSLIQDLVEKSAQEIERGMKTAFYKIYVMLNWKREAWSMFKRYLVDGVLAFQIIYDNLDHPKMITNIVDVDPCTLTKEVEDGIIYWVQFKGIEGRERKLLDAEIIYIKYEDSGVSTRQSYLERLIRPFNIYRIIEQAQIIWTVTQSSFKTIFTIPVAGMNRAKALQTLQQAMQRYKEDISFNGDTGELSINNKKNMPWNKEYWMPENSNGTPQIEQLVDNGPSLNDSEQLKYFENKLYKLSKIPSSRFDSENQQSWFGSDATQQLRDEITFSRYVMRIRNAFAEMILKPIRIQLTLSIPDIKNDKRILDAVSLHWNSYNQFEEMMNIEIMGKRVEFIQTMKEGIVDQDAEGNDVPFFCSRFLVERYLKMSPADLELNAKYKKLDKAGGKEEKEGGDEEGGDEDMMGGGDEGPGAEPDEGNDIDSEMLGDVQPESTETTQA